MEDAAVDQDFDVLDFSRGLTDVQKEKLFVVDTVPSELIDSAWKIFKGDEKEDVASIEESVQLPDPCTVYEHKDFPGMAPLAPSFDF
jgi:alkylated DNA repair protein alkB family protein 1